jgi:hypothetical protein
VGCCCCRRCGRDVPDECFFAGLGGLRLFAKGCLQEEEGVTPEEEEEVVVVVVVVVVEEEEEG